jgi:hypothetical protein
MPTQARNAAHDPARVMEDAAHRIEDQKPQPFGPSGELGFRQRHAFQRGDHIVREHRQTQPGGIGSET